MTVVESNKLGRPRAECSVCGGPVVDSTPNLTRPLFCNLKCLQVGRVHECGDESDVWLNGDGHRPIAGTGLTLEDAVERFPHYGLRWGGVAYKRFSASLTLQGAEREGVA